MVTGMYSVLIHSRAATTNKSVFFVNAVARLAQAENLDFPEHITLVNVVAGCSEEWSVQELRAQAIMKNARSLDSTILWSNQTDYSPGENLDNRYAWVTRWSTQQQIVQVRAYTDSALVAKVTY